MRLMIETFNLNEMVNEIYLTMKILAKLKNIDLIVDNKLPLDFEINSDHRRIK